MTTLLNLPGIASHGLERKPFEWAEIANAFIADAGQQLAQSFPADHFRDIVGDDGEKSYHFRARPLLDIGCNRSAHAEALSPAWRQLAEELSSPEYRRAIEDLTGVDLTGARLEANITEYGQGAWLGPHLDLDVKLISHIFYFTESWSPQDGGTLRILGSSSTGDVLRTVPPTAGNSAIIVRSGHSWHDVEPVSGTCPRRALDVIFHRPGAASCLWVPEQPAPPPAPAGWRDRLSAIRHRLMPGR